jgi:AcrR family transcriptional regulator
MTTSSTPADGAGRAPAGSSGVAVDPRVARTREAVQQAVRELVGTDGIEAVTHARVAELAGVGRASVYRHWPDRTHLLLDALAELREPDDPAATGDLRADLARELTRLREVLASPSFVPQFLALLGRAEWEPELAALKAEMLANGTARLRHVLDDAVARGAIASDLDLDDAVASLAGPLFFRRVLAGGSVTPRFADAVIDRFLSGSTDPRGRPG